MTIEKKTDGSAYTLALEGRLDTISAPEFEAALKQVLEDAQTLTLDFSRLEYISSAGLRMLLMAHKAMASKGGMKVTHVNEMVNEVFEITGFSDVLTVE